MSRPGAEKRNGRAKPSVLVARPWRAQSTSSTVNVQSHDEFDEIVVGRWLHIERMSATDWWARIGDVTLSIVTRRDGRVEVRVTDGGEVQQRARGAARLVSADTAAKETWR